ncbi:aminopeptidase P Ecym_7293 [Eremothecium cymbalariae DBVPG|uniref:Xaa-Pro aminopeptidase n=1 Tax=Eremothecium cymbalariae (strain CBS 270.75 / DBVPG 7215 / KCTC 17166 / NRRL Y-17582) TaxID=931890 RepID=G8JWB6_ERECY|nr:hypothetical protein Ecym_7293 [Eremothecium cymbalariae DBVPG\
MTTRSLNIKPSMGSMKAVSAMGTAVTQGEVKPFKPCANCNCTPGQLWRQGRRTSQFLKQISNSRRASGVSGSRGGSNESVYSSDSISQSRSISTTERLVALRKEMAKHDLGCYVIPSEDEHQSEYVADSDKRRGFVSGFTGSTGVACVTRNMLNFNEDAPDGKAVLSTDGRYFNQAAQELDQNWSLIREGEDSLDWSQWCVNEAYDMSLSLGGKTVRIGVDPRLISYSKVTSFRKQIDNKLKGCSGVSVELVPLVVNLVDVIWDSFEKKPERDLKPLLFLEYAFSGKSYKEKREELMKYMKQSYPECEALCVVALDEICWLLNLRGMDIEYNPVFYSYLLLDGNSTTLFTDNPLSAEISAYLKDNGLTVKPYGEVWNSLKNTAAVYAENSRSLLVSSFSSWEVIRNLESARYVRAQSPIQILKAVKNEIEIKNARHAQLKEAVCLIQYFSWLEEEVVRKEKLIDEYKAAQKLLEIRKTQKNFKGNSFSTISATGANASVIHYSPPSEGSTMICPYKIYLCDAGSQFLEGTTDITRTLYFSSPSQEECDNYTLVLKGCLALERMVFPEGIRGCHIDVMARQFLWQQGLDYRHGTGHGVGSFLNVHEGPIGIGISSRLDSFQPFEKGNIVTNEPGYYKDGEYGIRIENDMLVVDADHLKFGKKKFLKFENITLVPYCRKLISIKLLTAEEKSQINEYYSRIWSTVAPLIQPQGIAFKWLKRETAPL